MKCMIPAQNVKILARALHSLSRIGEELFVDPLINGLSLCTVNSSQSAFAEVIFSQSFFSSYSIGVETPDALPKCKISMRSCLSVFKSPHSMDKMVDWCQLRLEPDSVQFIFQVKFSGGSTKTYFLPIIECESLQVRYNKSDSTRLVATSKLLSGVVKNFRLNEDEITLSITKPKTTFKNHVDSTSERNKTVRTELGLLAGEFETYSVVQPISVTFCLKQLRAALSFAEPTGLPITIYFDTPGRPVVFTASNESVYEANFVVSSLQSGADSQSQGTQKSDVFINSNLLRQDHRSINREVNCNNANVMPNCSKNIDVPNNLSDFTNSGNRLSVDQSASRKRTRDGEEVPNLNRSVLLSDSILKGKDPETQDTVLLEDNNNVDLYDNVPSSPQNSPKFLVNNVFGRCFNSTFQRNLLPGFANVIAYDSDGLEDSD